MKHFMFVIIAALIVVGCGGSKELEKAKPSETASIVKEYEDKFRPSDYDMDAKIFLSELKREKEKKNAPGESPTTDPTVLISGFRVQMLATTDIDEANAEAEATLVGEWLYITFDPPAYKLRAGNFLVRDDAEEYAKFLQENGYPDSWVVPEKVFKNVQPRPIPPPTEPAQQVEPPK
jgi:hypothetical protein